MPKTARQQVTEYAKRHGLRIHGSEKNRDIQCMDKQGHWSEAWQIYYFETWMDLLKALVAIEREFNDNGYFDGTRPWEQARKNYTGKMKPLAAA